MTTRALDATLRPLTACNPDTLGQLLQNFTIGKSQLGAIAFGELRSVNQHKIRGKPRGPAQRAAPLCMPQRQEVVPSLQVCHAERCRAAAPVHGTRGTTGSEGCLLLYSVVGNSWAQKFHRPVGSLLAWHGMWQTERSKTNPCMSTPITTHVGLTLPLPFPVSLFRRGIPCLSNTK